MRYLNHIFLGLALLAPTALAAEVPDYPAEKVSERTWVIHGPLEYPNPKNRGFMNNPSFTVTDKSVVVIDPGSSLQSGEMVLRQLAKITDKPVTHVFSTHIHGDHWLGNHAIANIYPKAKFYAHPNMIKMAHNGEADSWIDLMHNMTEGATDGTKPVIPGEALSNGQEITVDGITFRAHLTKHAHTKTDLMVEIVEDSLLVTGDNILKNRIARMDDGSFRGSAEACDIAKSTAVKTYVPGHGPTGDAEATLMFCDYLTNLYEMVGEKVEEGLSDFEIKPLIQDEFKQFADWPGFDVEFGKHISLAVLEYEQAAFE